MGFETTFIVFVCDSAITKQQQQRQFHEQIYCCSGGNIRVPALSLFVLNIVIKQLKVFEGYLQQRRGSKKV